MATTVRTYRHTPDVATDPSGTLVDTEVDASDLPGDVTVDTTGWTAGDVEITVTAQLDGEAESEHSNALDLTVESAGGISIASNPTAVKAYSSTRVITLPQLVLSSGQRAALVLTAEDTASGSTFSFASLGFTPAARSNRPAGTPACLIDIFWADPGAGTYNGTATLSNSGDCSIQATWIIFDGAAATPGSAVTGVDVGGGGNSRATMPISTTGTGSIVIGAMAAAESGQAAGVANTVAAGDTDDCSILVEQLTESTHRVLRIDATVNSGTHNIGLRTPLSAVWTIGCLEVLAA